MNANQFGNGDHFRRRSLKRKVSTFLTFLCLALTFNAQSQQSTISGSIKDTAGYSLSGAVVALLDEQGIVLHFAISDNNGAFQMPFGSRGFWLDAGLMGYVKIRHRLKPDMYHYKLVLTPETRVLSEVVVKQRPPTELLGDTLKYYVKNFATKEDRSIGDVIRRLPGVEVARDGSIFFNGRKIENLYIEGDDLMDGRYGMAVRVIKKELIESVDIIRNHQPIAVLKDKVFTDNVALNLVLKDSNSLKLSASAQLGFGLPKQVEGAVAPILLSKSFKSVNRFAYNNSGLDYRAEFQQLGGSNFTDNIAPSSSDVRLSVAAPAPPDVPQSYYYFNHSGVVNLNTLFKNKQGWQFKINGIGFSDDSRFSYTGSTITYLLNDTITFMEEQSTLTKARTANLSFNIMANKKQFFVSNTLKGNLSDETVNGGLAFNNRGFEQQVTQRFTEFTNDLTWMPSFKGKGILEFRSLLGQRSNRQNLSIRQGYQFPVAPQEGYYENVNQFLQSPLTFHHTYISYKIPGRVVTQDYKIGYRRSTHNLTSALQLDNGSTILPYANDRGNDLGVIESAIYVASRFQIRTKQFRADLQLPVSLQSAAARQTMYRPDDRKRALLLLPDLNLNYSFSPERYLRATYQAQNTFSDITELFSGAILLNFRSLQAFDQGVQLEKSHRATLNYTHQHSIKLFFFNAGVNFRRIILPNIQSDSFSNSILRGISLLFPNKQTSWTFYGNISQYVFPLKAKFGLRLQWQRSASVQLLNKELLDLRSNGLSSTVSFDKRISSWFDLNYQGQFSWANVQLFSGTKPTISNTEISSLNQVLRLNAILLKKYVFGTTGTHRVNWFSEDQGNRFFFLDASLKKMNALKGLDVSLDCLNLFDVKEYLLFVQQSSQVAASRYSLRGRMLLLRLNYTF